MEHSGFAAKGRYRDLEA